ncbi:MAG: cell division protein FtsZ [Candidatus Pacebacteria bacterium]|jgi:cell division protein FtsZ|nr:cell division protein FtsZ [Candidatus Paceibacterota bacterium]MDD3072344.1 cell division protein FtsZ [Candidatus Paceibacterota bacterium]MDD3728726.1 cell division protein FtsZ [Candidatus Paceibacterota bacterium]MDD4201416.1 cell division protein FtsZ [Candidatus Paceibacterota bacterium]MDD4467498.1 cell division protein FtsZ [Candidatus Paceibacterota bacterium]
MKKKTNIKVIGVGGSGSNAVSRMLKCKIKGVDFVTINADAQDLNKIYAGEKIRIGVELTKGLGTGMNPDVGKKAAEEQKEEIKNAIEGANMVFIACGLGGGCGTGAAPVVAQIAKEMGALTIAVCTKPFSFEGAFRMEIAQKGLKELKEKVDSLIVVSNDKLLSAFDKSTTVSDAFWFCDEILRQAVSGISDLIVLPGIINTDFADIKAIMKNSGTALFGTGIAKGEQRAKEAAKRALNSPLLDFSCKGAKGILFNISGGEDISLLEVEEAANLITAEMDPSARVIFGAIQDEKLKKGEIKVTIIATGF